MAEENVTPKEDGDVHDVDSGEYLFTLDPSTGLPAGLQILHGGWWYVYKMDGRHKDDLEEPEVPVDDTQKTAEVIQLNPKDPLKDL